MRIFKIKTFARWMRMEGLSDAGLIIAVGEMEERPGRKDIEKGEY